MSPELQQYLLNQQAQKAPQGNHLALPGASLFPRLLTLLGFDQTRRSGVGNFFSGLSALFRSIGQPYGWGYQAVEGLFRFIAGLFMFSSGNNVYRLFGVEPPFKVEANKQQKPEKPLLDPLGPKITHAYNASQNPASSSSSSSPKNPDPNVASKAPNQGQGPLPGQESIPPNRSRV